ncbi:uncharacterized protein N7473_007314 [Penicillium subrubescens]|uniref:uncharacterized protein n=1 Tax=Penicillium subrubescens TaxID=1316194 RepID=UPI00254523D5|nr:uncharacterized protein N7473_007314 [Penicillium subrubescens]KAJ5891086.1 hypothetical protein N7473_007314 [Penicillium subrubescens]
MPLRSRWSQWCAFRSWIRTQSTPFLPFTTPISLGRSAKFASTGSSDPSDPHDVELARKWLKAFESGVKSIPRHVGQVSFSRSSGPGGQNVNKSVQIRSVRTVPPHSPLPSQTHNFCRAPELTVERAIFPGKPLQTTLKVPLATIFPLVPRLLHPPLRASRYATDRSQALVIQSDESRQQATNVDLCYAKLNRLLVISAKEVIPGETSQEQKDRVSKLQRAQNEARLKEKKIHSSKKSNRRGSKYDD